MNTLKDNIGWVALAGVLLLTLVVILGTSNTAVERVIEKNIGALTSPDLPYNYLGIGGFRFFTAHSSSPASSTTTPWALQAPAKGKLLYAACDFTTSSTTATTVTFARASTAYATTSSLGTVAFAADGTGLHQATTTSNDIFSRNEYLVIGMQGGANNYTSNSGGAAYSPAGTCSAIWLAI